MVRVLLAAVFAATGHGSHGGVGTAVTATFPGHGVHGTACVVGGACHKIRR